jgi:hypothetical protein
LQARGGGVKYCNSNHPLRLKKYHLRSSSTSLNKSNSIILVYYFNLSPYFEVAHFPHPQNVGIQKQTRIHEFSRIIDTQLRENSYNSCLFYSILEELT